MSKPTTKIIIDNKNNDFMVNQAPQKLVERKDEGDPQSDSTKSKKQVKNFLKITDKNLKNNSVKYVKQIRNLEDKLGQSIKSVTLTKNGQIPFEQKFKTYDLKKNTRTDFRKSMTESMTKKTKIQVYSNTPQNKIKVKKQIKLAQERLQLQRKFIINPASFTHNRYSTSTAASFQSKLPRYSNQSIQKKDSVDQGDFLQNHASQRPNIGDYTLRQTRKKKTLGFPQNAFSQSVNTNIFQPGLEIDQSRLNKGYQNQHDMTKYQNNQLPLNQTQVYNTIQLRTDHFLNIPKGKTMVQCQYNGKAFNAQASKRSNSNACPSSNVTGPGYYEVQESFDKFNARNHHGSSAKGSQAFNTEKLKTSFLYQKSPIQVGPQSYNNFKGMGDVGKEFVSMGSMISQTDRGLLQKRIELAERRKIEELRYEEQKHKLPEKQKKIISHHKHPNPKSRENPWVV